MESSELIKDGLKQELRYAKEIEAERESYIGFPSHIPDQFEYLNKSGPELSRVWWLKTTFPDILDRCVDAASSFKYDVYR